MPTSKTPPTEFEKRLMLAVADLREGEVVSYGDIAARAGKPEAPRAAGRFLSKTTYQVPWWRVVYSNGKLAACNLPRQAAYLEAEGVEVRNDRVVSSPLGRFRRRKRVRKK